ncbi:hypothetical protein ACSLOU_00655 [Enterobacter cloacae]|uniref:hypothetical protein n=1 Tax=Enterobacter cloacae TaxID=550 RepID=UPI003EDF15F4
MTSEFKVVQVMESDYLRLVKEAKENVEKSFPFTAEELHEIYVRMQESRVAMNDPLIEKVREMFVAEYKREWRG